MAVTFGLKTEKKRILAGQIADRLNLYGERRLNFKMDLSAADAEFDLDLQRLLAAGEFDFHHDIDGITRHMDRETGLMGGFFVPRFTV